MGAVATDPPSKFLFLQSNSSVAVWLPVFSLSEYLVTSWTRWPQRPFPTLMILYLGAWKLLSHCLKGCCIFCLPTWLSAISGWASQRSCGGEQDGLCSCADPFLSHTHRSETSCSPLIYGGNFPAQCNRSNPAEVNCSACLAPQGSSWESQCCAEERTALHGSEQMQVRHPVAGCTINPILWLKSRKKG